MPTRVLMIPARLGSKCIKGKNLRLLGGRPLLWHVAMQAKEAGVFDDIYVNSEGEIFREMAEAYGIRFYKRPDRLAADDATNDDFAHDFMNTVPCDLLFQINPTSPFTRANDIRGFVERMSAENLEAMLSVKQEQVEAFYDGRPVNFDPTKQMPRSQDLTPVFLHCSNMFGWDIAVYKRNMQRY